MAVSTRFCFTCVLVAVFSISYQGVSGQVMECAKNAVKSCIDSFRTSGDIEERCKSIETYYNCIETAFMQQCGIGEDVMVHVRELFAKYKCSAPGLHAVSVPGSASGLPAVSALCLLMAALFHMLL
uniref:Uncharacterized protein LOC111123606 n=1 Tax=Crassostrea virginica TaxID=6565 RepID=A0A8B8D100_CRAVI|nr:uncharacterized protein LOC111123606 [Crassostrea virginica]